jgi:hypothetical protein
MQSIKDVSVVKAVSCNIDGQHTVFKIRIQKTEDDAKSFYVNRRFKEFEELRDEVRLRVRQNYAYGLLYSWPKHSKTLSMLRSQKNRNSTLARRMTKFKPKEKKSWMRF